MICITLLNFSSASLLFSQKSSRSAPNNKLSAVQVNIGDKDRVNILSVLDEKPGAEPVTFLLFDEALCQVLL